MMKIKFDMSFTLKYRTLLSLVAISALTSHLFTLLQVEANQYSAAIINQAGKQRMYTQRIASFATQYARGDSEAAIRLEETIQQFESHRAELAKNIATREGLMVYRLLDIRSEHLKSSAKASNAIDQYIEHAHHIAAHVLDSPELHFALKKLLEQANKPILTKLDRFVMDEQAIAEGQIRRIKKTQTIGFMSILFWIVLGVFTVFRPMLKTTHHLSHLANVDALTGTLNRRAFVQRANEELARAKRYQKPLSLLALDVDHFKSINDRYGHGGGDAALVALSTCIQQSLRTSDALGRWGGEEFVILLAETSLQEAAIVAERYRSQLAELSMQYGLEHIHLTVSLGAADANDSTEDVLDLIEKADQALYAAKHSGRNRVMVFAGEGIFAAEEFVSRA